MFSYFIHSSFQPLSLLNLASIYLSNFLFQQEWLALFLGTIISNFIKYPFPVLSLHRTTSNLQFTCRDTQVRKLWDSKRRVLLALYFYTQPGCTMWIFNQTNLPLFWNLLSLLSFYIPIFILSNCLCRVQCSAHCCLSGNICWLPIRLQPALTSFLPPIPHNKGWCRTMTKRPVSARFCSLSPLAVTLRPQI